GPLLEEAAGAPAGGGARRGTLTELRSAQLCQPFSGVERVWVVSDDAAKLLGRLLGASGPLEDLAGHVPQPKIERAGELLLTSEGPQDAEGFGIATEIGQRRGPNHRSLSPYLLGDRCANRLQGRPHRVLRRP